jgi:multiple sugar transport system ATP-binding protein
LASLSFSNVSKTFGNVKAVDDVSFTINDGDLVCLLGPSGCGKTTTLRLIAGLEKPSSGRILMNDRDVTEATPKERDIGMVFQDYALYPHMNLEDNITYPLKVRGVKAKERRRRAEEVGRSLQIDHLLDRRPGQISGGQQQRVSVARAVVHKPRIFLFDEPLSNLDARLRLEARSFLKHLQNELGVTAVYVTHDQAEAMALADHIAVMEGGKIVQMAPPLEVYHRPATTFVANFLGSPPMNLLPVTFTLTDAEARLESESFSLSMNDRRDALTGLLEPGQPLVLGIRPEHLQIVRGDGPWTIAGEVYATEPLGPEALITLSVEDSLVTARIFGDEPPDVRGRVHFKLDPRRIHLYRDSGERIALP